MLNQHPFLTPPIFWRLTYQDGSQVTSAEARWVDISVPVTEGETIYQVTPHTQPVASLFIHAPWGLWEMTPPADAPQLFAYARYRAKVVALLGKESPTADERAAALPVPQWLYTVFGYFLPRHLVQLRVDAHSNIFSTQVHPR